MRVRIGSASRPASGQTACGDVSVVIPIAEGTLICLADGLGHGPEARAVAEAACRHARAHAAEPLDATLRGMDAALAGTRGAAVSLLALLPTTRRARFIGVGNVELRALARARIAPPTSPGIVGRRLPPVRVWEYPLAEGDVLVLLTDGISGRFELDALAHLEPPALAEEVVRQHRKSHDDACCVAVKVALATGKF